MCVRAYLRSSGLGASPEHIQQVNRYYCVIHASRMQHGRLAAAQRGGSPATDDVDSNGRHQGEAVVPPLAGDAEELAR